MLRPDAHRGTVALVTGGGTPLGRAVPLDLARCGADVVIAGRRPEPLEKTAAEIEAIGSRALAVPADIREDDTAEDRAQWEAAVPLGRLGTAEECPG